MPTVGSNNPFPSILIDESTQPTSPASGHQRLYIDTADNALKRVNSTGGVRTIEGAAGDLLDLQYIRKAGDQSVTSSTAYVSDDTLNVPIGASQEWIIDWHLILTGNSSGDFKFALNVPASCTGYLSLVSGLVTGATAINGDNVLTATTDLTDGANFAVATVTGAVTTVTIRGVIINSTNAGTVTLRWAQNGSNGTATVVKANSHVIARRFV